MTHTIRPLPSDKVAAWRNGAPDDYGLPPELAVSDGDGTPCRHCLRNVPKGAGMLILTLRPFTALHPYAEAGPIFLCADECAPWQGDGMPPILTLSPTYLVKGYLASERIAYGTGDVVPAAEVPARIDAILARGDIAFVDIRSARNNCFQARAYPA